MAGAPAFEWLCQAIEDVTSMNRLEARGTVRLALRRAGLDGEAVTSRELIVVIGRLLPSELASRSVDAAEQTCASLAAALGCADLPAPQPQNERPEDVFRRLAG